MLEPEPGDDVGLLAVAVGRVQQLSTRDRESLVLIVDAILLDALVDDRIEPEQPVGDVRLVIPSRW